MYATCSQEMAPILISTVDGNLLVIRLRTAAGGGAVKRRGARPESRAVPALITSFPMAAGVRKD